MNNTQLNAKVRGPYEIIYTNAFLAGIVSGIAGIAYLSAMAMFGVTPVGKLVGSVLFSFGLLTICNKGWWLYTGAIGTWDLSNKSKQKRYFIMGLIANLLSLWLVSCFAFGINPTLRIIAETVVATKLTMPWFQVLFASIGCGVCMYLACTAKNDYMIMFSVIIFILCGFEHVLADFFYICLVKSINPFTLETTKFLGLALIGNTIGANIIRGITNSIDKGQIIQ